MTEDGGPRSTAETAPATGDRERLRAIRDLMASGRYAAAEAAAADLALRPALRPIAQRLVAACRHAMQLRFRPAGEVAGMTATILDEIGRADTGQPAAGDGPQVVESPGSDRVVFVFAGADQAPFAHVVVQTWLKRYRCHAVHVRDPRSQFSITGLPGLAPDLPGCIAALRALADRLGATRRFCLGYSANGFSALRYGIGLEADAVLAFSPVTTLAISPKDIERFPMIRRLHAENPHLVEDVLPHYRAAKKPPRVTIVFGAANRSDRWAAMRMGVLPGVRLIPVPGLVDHDSLGVTMVARRFGPLLDEMFAPTVR